MTPQAYAPDGLQVYSPSSLQGITLQDVWKIIARRKLAFFAALLLTLGCAVVYSVVSTRRYVAVGEIQVQKDASDALGLDSLMSGGGAAGSDALDANVNLQTQAKILESETLALKVVDKLQLAETPDFRPHFSVLGSVSGLFAPKGVADAPGAPLELSPNKRDRIVAVFKGNLKVAPVAGTRLIDVSYTSTDPKLAAAVVNQLIESLIDYNFQTRYQATEQASDWLGKQLSDLRVSSESLQAQVASLQRDSGVFSFGGQEIDGKGTAYSTVLDQLQQTTASLTQAQGNRITKRALYEATKSGDPDVVAGLSGSPLLAGSSPAVTNSLALLQNLRGQEATEKGLISEMAAKFGPGYPKLEEMKANLASIQQSMTDEQGRLRKQTASDAEVAQAVEDHLRSIFEDQKKSAAVLNDKSIQFQLVRQEAEQSRGLYERLLSRLKEAGVTEGLRSSNITVVEPGRIAAHPANPKVKLLLLLGMVLGSVLGLGSAFGAELMDSKVHDLQQMTHRFGDAFLGDLPFERDRLMPTRTMALSGSSSIFSIVKPQSYYSESLRGLRTALLLARGGSPPKVILITSSLPGEGKSTLSANLAALLAQQGKRVLLVDGDLRRSTLHQVFGISNAVGLSSLLTCSDPACERGKVLETIAGIGNLSIVPAGPVPPYPSELLGSAQMRTLLQQWQSEYDFVLFDGAPVLPVTDSVVLASLADQILLVARHAVTENNDLERSFRLLQTRTENVPIGIVMNAVKRPSDSYYKAYGYGADESQKGLALHA